MPRFAAVVLCALTALAVQATPVPPPKPYTTPLNHPAWSTGSPW